MAYSKQARTNMITNQLEPSGVSAVSVIDVMKDVPREKFVPEEFKGSAYIDEDIPLGHGRFLVEPRVFAKILQAVDVQPTDKVLDIACGTGYSSVVLSRLAKSVVAVESIGELAEVARKNVRSMKANVELFCASITGGYSLKAPYDLILINGAIEQVPEEILDQMSNGGKLVAIIVGEQSKLQRNSEVGQVVCWTRTGDEIHKAVLFDAALPILPDFNRKPEFKF